MGRALSSSGARPRGPLADNTNNCCCPGQQNSRVTSVFRQTQIDRRRRRRRSATMTVEGRCGRPAARPTPWPCSSLLLFLSFLCSVNFMLTARGHSELGETADKARLVAEQCKRGLDFERLEDFGEFLTAFKLVLKEEQWKQLESIVPACHKHKEAILELEPLIELRNVCDPIKIDQLKIGRAHV